MMQKISSLLLYDKRILALIIIIIVTLSTSFYILQGMHDMISSQRVKSQTISNNSIGIINAPLPINNSYIYRVNYPYEEWSYMILDDQASKYVGEIVANG
jgi:hypothetical protein